MWVVDQEAIIRSDDHTIQQAKAGLQDIFQSSYWYSARYAAGIALDMEPSVDSIYQALLIDFSTNKLMDRIQDAGALLEMSGSKKIRRLLESCYNHNPDELARREAGKQLGYCRLRIGVHELLQ
jgi:hypothetical protein